MPKLYELPRNTLFRIVGDTEIFVPPAAPPVERGTVYKLHNIDGMYSYCTDTAGNVFHIAAYSDVIIERKQNEN